MIRIKPLLILDQDRDWSMKRQVPLEPSRWGKVSMINEQKLNKFPLIKTYLKKNNYYASYYSWYTAKQRIVEKRYTLTKQDKELLILAKEFVNNGDVITGYVINSLIFEVKDYKDVEKHIHFRLSSSMLGPNRGVVKSIQDTVLEYAKRNSTKDIVILDPFAGNGSLGLILAEELVKNNIKQFLIINNDLSMEVKNNALHELDVLVHDRLHAVKKYLKYVHGNGLSLKHISDRSIDLVVTLRALHEHSESQTGSFLKSCLNKLKSDGVVIIDDVTRERVILDRAKKLLPFLAKMTAFRLILEGTTKIENVDHLATRILDGDPYLEQAGVQSYISGYELDELKKIAVNAGFEEEKIVGLYDYDNPFPLGSMILKLSR